MRRSLLGDFRLGELRRRLIAPALVAMLLVSAGSIPLLLRAQGPGAPPPGAQGGPLPPGMPGGLPPGGPPPDLAGDPNNPNNGPANDPPTRAARLALVEGNVSFQPGGVEDWVPATLNRPIATGDRLWTDAGARTELNLGSSAFRLNGRTNFTFVNLTDSLAQAQVSSGTLDVRVRRLADQESVEIDTPQAAFTLLRAGEYRIDVTEQGDATIATVRGGDAEVAAGGQTFPLHPRDQVRVMEENGQPVFDRRAAPVADAFDNWCDDRDRREDRSPSARYVSRDMPGYADLDDHGVWSEQPGVGMVWAPRVPVGWAPYHNGHWAWIEPWGWTWVDDAPWGYAPFHYGRWAFVGAGWVWVPGPVVVGVRPVYAPALVAWVGGGGFGVSIGIGVGPAVGWFPLGPREVWVPPYRYSPAYITQVNVTNTVIVNRTVINNVNVTNVNYVNRGVPGAMTAVPQGAMVAGRPIAAAAVSVPPGVAARATVGAYAAVAPQRGAVVGGQAPSNFAPPAALANRTMVARTAPPAPPVSFNQRQAALQQNPGQPLNRAQVSQIQQSQPQQGARPAFRPALAQATPPAGGVGQNGGRPQFGQQQPGAGGQAAGGQAGGGQPGGFQGGNRGQFGGAGTPAGTTGGGQPAGSQSGSVQPGGARPQFQQQSQQQVQQNAAPARPAVQPATTPPPAKKAPPKKSPVKGREEKRKD
jgi:hypothetical protein